MFPSITAFSHCSDYCSATFPKPCNYSECVAAQIPQLKAKKQAVVDCLYCRLGTDEGIAVRPVLAHIRFREGVFKAAQQLLDQVPGNCSLCRRLCLASSLCPACCNALPWQLNSCPHCALQQVAMTDPAGETAASAPCGFCATHPPRVKRCVAPLQYREPVDRLIAGFKFHARFADGRSLALLLADAVRHAYRDDCLPELIIPMPLHRRRWRERGYNQAMEIGRVVSSALELELSGKLVSRRRATAAQTSLTSIQARQRNVAGAFSVSASGVRTLGELHHVAIVDDVITTMATVNALAACLQQQGIERVDAWCLARAVRHASDTVTEQLVNNPQEV